MRMNIKTPLSVHIGWKAILFFTTQESAVTGRRDGEITGKKRIRTVK
jgi:hypothetical protein